MTGETIARQPFRPRARMLLLLGDQLIRDAAVAVFELVKNAYDADAAVSTVTLRSIEEVSKASITIEDDGEGMDWETVTGVWLEPGTDFRAQQRREDVRTRKYHRLPLGEKGVGRFAVHKLGRHIVLTTRKAGHDEIVVAIDWTDFAGTKYLSDVPVAIRRRPPEHFTGKRTGTRIDITGLWQTHEWTRGRLRDLARGITSICSPFNKPDDFLAELVLKPDPGWLKGLLDMSEVLDQAIFIASGTIDGACLKYAYEFRPLKAMKARLKGRKKSLPTCPLERADEKGTALDLSRYHIGPVTFNFHIFDREPAVLNLTTGDKAGLKRFLDVNGGVRVYRDGVRVYDFGEPGNDWLDLGGRRVNIPSVRVSNNQIIGAVALTASKSRDLVEKTNREGFIESPAYEALRQAVLFALTQVEADRKIDKVRLRAQYSRKRVMEPVVEELAELRDELVKRKLDQELGRYLDRIDTQFQQVRDTLLTAAGSGLTLTTVIHEVEKIIKELVAAVKRGADRQRISALVMHLDSMIDGLAYLVRKTGLTWEKASVLIHQALFNTEFRLRAHRIGVTCGTDNDDPDFEVRCTRRLIVSTLMNLIDNSIHWLGNKGSSPKKLYIGTTREPEGRPTIIVADNGPGFSDPPEYVVEPFFTRKAGGMGLGLHLANEVARVHKGRLVFPDGGDISLPRDFTGAIVGIEFPGER